MNDMKNEISMEKIKVWFGRLRHGKETYKKEGIKPKNDWNFIIVASAVIFCLGGMLAAFIYFQIENGAWFQKPQDDTLTEVSINQNLLQKITGQIDTKAAAYSASSGVSVGDPSL
jgi:hypothetical protein